MTQNITIIRTMNFVVGLALLTMLAPLHGKPAEKPAGVRNAIELVSKKLSIAGPSFRIA